MKKGKLIVLDGTDGTGKTTHTQLLVKRLRREGVNVETLNFPRYYDNLFGKLVGECLAGKRGDFLHIDPHIASVLYAADRFESKEIITKWLQAGKTVILDRYVSANQIHQGGKIQDAQKRREFLRWLDKMEHGVFGLPRPDLILYLSLPTATSLRLIKERRKTEKKKYLGKKKDVHEGNPAHLLAARQSALKLVKSHAHWRTVDCADGSGNMLPVSAVHERVYNALKKAR
jgi:dTMP kinase